MQILWKCTPVTGASVRTVIPVIEDTCTCASLKRYNCMPFSLPHTHTHTHTHMHTHTHTHTHTRTHTRAHTHTHTRTHTHFQMRSYQQQQNNEAGVRECMQPVWQRESLHGVPWTHDHILSGLLSGREWGLA